MSDETPLDRAIFELRQAAQLHDPDEYDLIREDASMDHVKAALSELDDHVTDQIGAFANHVSDNE